MRRTVPPALLAAALLAAACTDVSTGTDEPVAISFDTVPSPSVVVGDTIRDTTGAAVPLRAQVFNARGSEIPDPPVVFLTRDTLGVIRTVDDTLPNGWLIADSIVPNPIELVAVVGRLQSTARRIDIVRPPERLRARTDTVQTLEYTAGADTATSRDVLQVVVERDSSGTLVGVKSWYVRFSIVYPADPSGITLVTAGTAPTGFSQQPRLAITDGTGVAGRRIRIRPRDLTSPEDSVVVEARATYRTELPGSPVKLVFRYKPRT